MGPYLVFGAAVLAAVSLPAQQRQRPDRTAVWKHLQATYDKDGDGKVTLAEYGRGKGPFQNLDRNRDDAITAADFERRRGGGRPGAGNRRRPGASARSVGDMLGSFINVDGEPGISKAEWQRAIRILAPNADGVIPQQNLSKLTGGKSGRMARMGAGMVARALGARRGADLTVKSLDALFAKMDQDGSGVVEFPAEIDMPPGQGEMAPDFTIPFANDAKKTVTLSSYRGKKPVGLIFGSYT